MARTGDLLRPVLSAVGTAARHFGRYHPHLTEEWMTQMARDAVDEIDGVSRPIRFVLHDRDSKFCAAFEPPSVLAERSQCCCRRAVRI
jgi:hypothetical protein